MAYKVWLKGLEKKPADAVDHYTIPLSEVELTPELVERCGLGDALQRLGDLLMEEHPEHRGCPSIGVRFDGVTFSFQLGRWPEKKS